MEKKQERTAMDARTAQEEWIIDSTPDYTPKNKDEWHIPMGILKGIMDISQARQMREETKVATLTPGLLFVVNDKINTQGKDLKLKLAELDGEGRTITDPIIVEVIEDNGKKRFIERTDVTEAFYDMYRERGIDAHIRTSNTNIEVRAERSELKG